MLLVLKVNRTSFEGKRNVKNILPSYRAIRQVEIGCLIFKRFWLLVNRYTLEFLLLWDGSCKITKFLGDVDDKYHFYECKTWKFLWVYFRQNGTIFVGRRRVHFFCKNCVVSDRHLIRIFIMTNSTWENWSFIRSVANSVIS